MSGHVLFSLQETLLSANHPSRVCETGLFTIAFPIFCLCVKRSVFDLAHVVLSELTFPKQSPDEARNPLGTSRIQKNER